MKIFVFTVFFIQDQIFKIISFSNYVRIVIHVCQLFDDFIHFSSLNEEISRNIEEE